VRVDKRLSWHGATATQDMCDSVVSWGRLGIAATLSMASARLVLSCCHPTKYLPVSKCREVWTFATYPERRTPIARHYERRGRTEDAYSTSQQPGTQHHTRFSPSSGIGQPRLSTGSGGSEGSTTLRRARSHGLQLQYSTYGPRSSPGSGPLGTPSSLPTDVFYFTFNSCRIAQSR
jgi:hypothetical protein